MRVSLYWQEKKVQHHILLSLLLSLAFFNAIFGLDYIFATSELTTNILLVGKVGFGTIRMNSENIPCGSQCQASFDSGSYVTLVATPAKGYVFAGWQYDCRRSLAETATLDTSKEPLMKPNCTIKMDAARKMAVALFRKSGTNSELRPFTFSAGTIMTLPPIEVIGTGSDTKPKMCIPDTILCADGFHPERAPKGCEMLCKANISPTPHINPSTGTGEINPLECQPVALRCTVWYHVEHTPGSCDVGCMPDARDVRTPPLGTGGVQSPLGVTTNGIPTITIRKLPLVIENPPSTASGVRAPAPVDPLPAPPPCSGVNNSSKTEKTSLVICPRDTM